MGQEYGIIVDQSTHSLGPEATNGHMNGNVFKSIIKCYKTFIPREVVSQKKESTHFRYFRRNIDQRSPPPQSAKFPEILLALDLSIESQCVML